METTSNSVVVMVLVVKFAHLLLSSVRNYHAHGSLSLRSGGLIHEAFLFWAIQFVVQPFYYVILLDQVKEDVLTWDSPVSLCRPISFLSALVISLVIPLFIAIFNKFLAHPQTNQARIIWKNITTKGNHWPMNKTYNGSPQRRLLSKSLLIQILITGRWTFYVILLFLALLQLHLKWSIYALIDSHLLLTFILILLLQWLFILLLL